MTKTIVPKNYVCTLLIGFVIMLLAGVLIVQTDSAYTSGITHQRLHIQQAVVSLEQQCFTCHSSPAENLQLIAYTIETEAPSAQNGDVALQISSPVDSYTNPVQPTIDTQLQSLGHRLLEIPDSNNKAYAAAVSKFLQVYKQTRNDTGPNSMWKAAEQLLVITHLLNIAENQAQPLKWIKTNEALSLFESAAPQNIPLPAPVLSETKFVCFDTAPEPESLTSGDCLHTSSQVFFVVNRRGPSVRTNDDFAWFFTERLTCISVQSPFLCIGSDTTIYTSVA